MKNKTHTRAHALIQNFRYIATPMVMGICLAHSVSAAITTWTGASDDNWSSAGNWDNGLPAGNDVIFTATDATGTSGPAGTVNNFVAADTGILSLRYNNLSTTGFHNTRIDSGVTLSLTGGDAVATTSANPILFVSSPATASTSSVVNATIRGAGTLSLNNPAANLHVGQGTAGSSNSGRATLDMSGLATFNATVGRIILGQQAVVGNRASGTILLAGNNTLNLTNTTANTPGLLLGDMSSNGGGSEFLELGTVNSIRTDTGITIGGRRSSGTLRFNSATVALGAGSAVFRNLAGTGRQAQWSIGDNNGASGSNNAAGLVDFSTRGEVDALVDTMIIGRAGTSTLTTLNSGTLTFDKGVIDTNSLAAGVQSASGAGAARGTLNVNGTAQMRINGNVTLGRDLSATLNADGIINIGVGTVTGGAVTIGGDVICGNGTGNKITLTTGSLSLGGKVGDDSVAGDAPLETLQLNGGKLTFNFGSAPNPTTVRAKVGTLNVPTPVTLSFTGTALSSALPDIPLIKYTTFDQATQFANLSLVDLPMRVNAALVNNVANSSVDLDIISVSFNKWSGATNGDWDINTTMNWLLDPVNTASTYLQPQIPGEPVTFDDSASGTKTVNLTTALSPSSITVNTAGTYTFDGVGSLSGPTGITKQGGGSLVIQNSGTNDFTGVVTIEAGTLKLGQNTPLGSTTAGTTVASGAVLDLNGQTVGAEAITLNGTGIGSTGALVNTSASTASLSSGLTLSGDTSIGGTGNITLGNIAQSGANRILTKVGSGTLTLDGTISYTGGTVASAGTLVLNNPAAFGAEKVTLAGGTISSNVNAGLGSTSNSNFALFIDAASTIDVAADKTVTINRINSSAPSAANVLSKTGPGTLRITGGGGNGNVLGGYKANAGTLFFNTGANALAGSGTIILDGGNATFTKNLSSQGVYNPYDLTLGLQVLQDATITQDAGFNDISPPGSNTLSFTSLTAGTSTLQIVKGPNALSSANPGTFYPSYTDPLVTFFGGNLSGNLTLNVGLNIGASLRGATGIGGLTKTGPGRLILADKATTLTPNSYSGPTIISTGTLALSGTHASAISVEDGAILEFTLNDGLSPIATSTAALTLDSGSTVSIVGTPVAASYTLASTAAPIGGTPVLSPLVPGYQLVVDGNLLKLNQTTVTTPFSTWVSLNTLVGMDALPGTDVENDGLSNLLEFVLVGDPKANDTPSVRPRIEDGPSAITLRFKRSNDSELQPVTVKVQVSANLGVWNPADDILIGGGNGTGPNGATYTVTPNGTFDDIVVTIPKNSATVKFARVQAVMP